MWTQIVGKVRLALRPHVNHWWQVPLYVSARGLTTTAIPYKDDNFESSSISSTMCWSSAHPTARSRTLKLAPKSVAAFLAEFMAALRALGIEVRIWTMPRRSPIPSPSTRTR